MQSSVWTWAAASAASCLATLAQRVHSGRPSTWCQPPAHEDDSRPHRADTFGSSANRRYRLSNSPDTWCFSRPVLMPSSRAQRWPSTTGVRSTPYFGVCGHSVPRRSVQSLRRPRTCRKPCLRVRSRRVLFGRMCRQTASSSVYRSPAIEADMTPHAQPQGANSYQEASSASTSCPSISNLIVLMRAPRWAQEAGRRRPGDHGASEAARAESCWAWAAR